jgi:hypothetical protein
MAETEIHLLDMIDTILLLRDYFAARPNVYVGGNLLLYYEEGNPRKYVAPDVLVALAVPKEPPRANYLVWKERKAPISSSRSPRSRPRRRTRRGSSGSIAIS